MNFLDVDFPGVTEAYRGSLEDWLELFERYAFPKTGDTETSTEMQRIFKRYTEVTYEDWLDIIIKCARDEIWYEEKINLSIRELYLVIRKYPHIEEKLKTSYNRLLEKSNLDNSLIKIEIDGKGEFDLQTAFMPCEKVANSDDFARPGIYLWKRLPQDNKSAAYYVGKAKNIKTRTQDHLRMRERDSKALHGALRSWTAEAFNIAIIRFCDVDDLNTLEQVWIANLDTYNCENDYNLTPGGDGGNGHKTVTSDMLRQVLDLLSDKSDNALSFTKIGKKVGLSTKTIRKINKVNYFDPYFKDMAEKNLGMSENDFFACLRTPDDISRIDKNQARSTYDAWDVKIGSESLGIVRSVKAAWQLIIQNEEKFPGSTTTISQNTFCRKRPHSVTFYSNDGTERVYTAKPEPKSKSS